MNETVRQALAQVLDYLMAAERADYEREAGQPGFDPDRHVYTDLCLIEEWLMAIPEDGPSVPEGRRKRRGVQFGCGEPRCCVCYESVEPKSQRAKEEKG